MQVGLECWSDDGMKIGGAVVEYGGLDLSRNTCALELVQMLY